MSVTVLFFGGLREQIGQSSVTLSLPQPPVTVADLRDLLIAQGGQWQALQNSRNLRAAVNQTMAAFDTVVADDDEVAFFPPVTGG